MSSLSTFRFDEQLTQTIDDLKNSSTASSKAEVVRRAITLLKLVQDAHSNGEKLVLRKEDNEGVALKEREIIIP
jgi:Arc/MetJ-type ribon-helix-helix transcriptional regulator